MGESTAQREQTRSDISIAGAREKANIDLLKKQAEGLPERQRGMNTVNTVLDEMAGNYEELNKLKGIPSTEGNVLENLGAGIGASPLGQQAGKMLGTEEQSLRNKIQGSLPILMQSIMKSTGMTASQLNSERELQNFMKAVTDPTTDIQAVRNQLNLIRKLYGVNNTPGPAQIPARQQNLSPRIENTMPEGWNDELEQEYQQLFGGGR